ncbi:tyrosine-type recombinase/integrase [Glycomyces niveus]|uniref:Integrase SAM-like N-terminal domain-containing protein n=1 Tax=Glycomyces niveus TaxID=2820287 RepID=A0ABS3U0D6_9ACTN|nr:hypothetical protein [Glycomyces sp. NEAU-S30]MBO3731731.1 hypothetical protein [Glycomyces sp. NEAU-S30]
MNGGAVAASDGGIRFGEYAERYWLPNHRIEASTREGYTCALRAHIMPFFGHCPLAYIVPTAIKQ